MSSGGGWWVGLAAVLAAGGCLAEAAHSTDINCPDRCQTCRTFAVNCTDTRYTNTDMFLQMRSNYFDKLDTLTVTGNTFGDITGSNLFGMEIVHQLLTKVKAIS